MDDECGPIEADTDVPMTVRQMAEAYDRMAEAARAAVSEARRAAPRPLQRRVLDALNASPGRTLSMRGLEARLAEHGGPVDTFEVRDAVWKLIDKRLADFTPGRDVKAAGRPPP